MKVKVKRMPRIGLEEWLEKNGLKLRLEEREEGSIEAEVFGVGYYSGDVMESLLASGQSARSAINALCLVISRNYIISIDGKKEFERCIVKPPDIVEEDRG